MHHKRRRPKNRRSGCLYCKPWKANAAKCRHPLQVLRVDISEREQRRDAA